MEGESAVQALFAGELRRLAESGGAVPDDLRQAIERTRREYERTLDAKWCAARGHVDAIIAPDRTRAVVARCLEAVPRGRLCSAPAFRRSERAPPRTAFRRMLRTPVPQ